MLSFLCFDTTVILAGEKAGFAETMLANGYRHLQVEIKLTCSGFSPGGTQAYSSKAQPESSSEVEFR